MKNPVLQNLFEKSVKGSYVGQEGYVQHPCMCAKFNEKHYPTSIPHVGLMFNYNCLLLNQKIAVIQLSDLCDKWSKVYHKNHIKQSHSLTFSVMTGTGSSPLVMFVACG